MRVVDERVVAQVVGSNPDCVGGRVLHAGEERLTGIGIDVFRVGDEGGEFVTFYIWEEESGREWSWGDVVGAYSA